MVLQPPVVDMSREPHLGATAGRLHVFADTMRFGRALARASGRTYTAVRVHRFPDGESLVRVAPPTRHAILVRSLHEPNAKLVEVLLAADALRRAGARRVTLVSPYLPYMRQDAVFAPGEPISQRVIGRLARARVRRRGHGRGAPAPRHASRRGRRSRQPILVDRAGRGGMAPASGRALARRRSRRRVGPVGPCDCAHGGHRLDRRSQRAPRRSRREHRPGALRRCRPRRGR